ncbi:hypothetical protein RB601_002225 [Gaeumannomyces tritici]
MLAAQSNAVSVSPTCSHSAFDAMAYHHGSGPQPGPGQAYDGQSSPMPVPRPYVAPQFQHPAAVAHQPYHGASPSAYLPPQGPPYAQHHQQAAPSLPSLHTNNLHHRPLPQHQQQQQQQQQQQYPHPAHAHQQIDPSPLTPLPPPVGYATPTSAVPQSYAATFSTAAFAPPQRFPSNTYQQQPANHHVQPLPAPGNDPRLARPQPQSRPSPLQQQQQQQQTLSAATHAQQQQRQQSQPQILHHQPQQYRQQPHQPTNQQQNWQNHHQNLQHRHPSPHNSQPNPQNHQAPQQQHQHVHSARATSSAPTPGLPNGGDIVINITDMKTRPESRDGNGAMQKGRIRSPNTPAPKALSKSPAMANSPLARSPALHKVQTGGVTKATGPSRSPALSKSPALSHSPAIARSPSVPSQPSLDHPSILIHVADECLVKAQEGALRLASSCSPEALGEYHKLVATGLACLEAAISSKKLSPRIEAKARLRYAGIVVEETENLMDAETMLTKGIALADKRLFLDLKYCTQYLLMKVLFRRTPKAALVALNKTINDCDTYKHVYWSYGFRLLKISLLLQSSGFSDTTTVLDSCKDITTLASKRGDRAIYVFTSLVEGLVHLRTSRADAIVRVQDCIAQAAKYQLESSTRVPQIDVLSLLLDLACSLRQKQPDASLQKMRNLQNMLEVAYKSSWETSEILLPLVRDQLSLSTISTDTSTIVRPGEGETDFLVVNFMSIADVFSLSYTLSGIAMLYTVSVTGDSTGAVDARCPESWREALKSLSNFANRKLPPEARLSLQPAMRMARWHSELKCYLFVLLGLTSGTHSEWAEVQRCVDNIDELMDDTLDANIQDLAYYLKAICYQGRCKLDEALEIFSSERFAIRLPRGSDEGMVPRELCLMAALNRLWIMASPKHQDMAKTVEIVEEIRSLCETHPDPDIKTVFNLVMASIRTDPPESINQVKRLFEGVVGDQALKSARAALAQANKVGNLLWKSVAEGMLASSYAMQSQRDEHTKRYADAVRFANEAAAKSAAVP